MSPVAEDMKCWSLVLVKLETIIKCQLSTVDQVLVGPSLSEYGGGGGGGGGGCDHGSGSGCGGGGGGGVGGFVDVGGGGGGGGVEQCSTVLETVSSVVEETGFETQCATVEILT